VGRKAGACPIKTAKITASKPVALPGLLRAVRNYWQHGANRDLVKALAYKYLPNTLLTAILLLPLGWMAAALAFIPAWLLSRHGEKRLEHLLTSGKLNRTQGPMARIAAMDGWWQMADDGKAKGKNVPVRIREELNALLDELFPGAPGSDADRLRRWLRMRADGLWFDRLNRAFHARQYYVGTSVGRVCRALSNTGRKIPIVPLQLLFRLPEIITMPVVSLFNMQTIRAMSRVNGKRVRRMKTPD
jgi:hypothetical protein